MIKSKDRMWIPIYAMHGIFKSNEIETILLVDAENAFNLINWKVLLHNMEYLFSITVRLLNNCCQISAQLFFIIGENELSREGTTQGDPPTMAPYVLGFTPLLDHLRSIKRIVKHAAFVDDLTDVGRLVEIKILWDTLMTEGPKTFYYSKLNF